MTDNSDKIRSLVLAALMVFSVFAGTVALTGTAAAADSPSVNTFTNTTVNESSTVTHDVSFTVENISDDGNTDSFLVSLPQQATITSTSNFEVTNASGNSISTSSGPSLTDARSGTNNAVSFSISPDTSATNQTVTVNFTATVDWGSVNSDTTSSANLTVTDSGNADISDAAVQTLTIQDTSSTSSDNASVTNGSVIYQGQDVEATGFAANEDVILRSGTVSEPGTFQNSYEANTDGVITFSTSALDTGENYHLEGGDGDTVGFEVVEHTLSLTVDDTDLGNQGGATTTTAAFDSNRQSFNAYVSADNLSASEVEMIVDDDLSTTQVDLNADGTNDAVEVTIDRNTDYTLNASGIDAGDYTLEFDVADTTATASTGFNVSDIGDGEAEFAQGSYQTPQGSVANISVDLSGAAAGTSGTLVVGLEDSEGYQANVTFEDADDDGQVNIMFNTYAAGSSSNGTVVWAQGDDTVTFNNSSMDDQSMINNILAQGDYTLSVSTAGNAADTVDQPQDLGALVIGPRSTDSMQLWTAPNNADLDADNENGITESDIASLIEDDVVTQDTTITSGDYVVHQISATGLEGLVESEGGLNGAIDNGISLSIVQTNPVQNQDAKEINLTASSSALDFVKGDGAYYVIADTGNLETVSGRDIAAGDEFKATFTVEDHRLLRSTSSDDYESVNATFTVEAAETTLDSDPVQVAASSGQAISGSTNYAPGTELTIRVRSSSDVSPGFFNTQTVTVQPDGTFSAEFDFSEQSAGDTFTVTVRNTNAEADGEVVESVSTETDTATEEPDTDTATEEPDTDTATEEPDTDTATEEPDTETETETSTTTPGFGVAVALVALLAAALLAGRRD